MKNQRTKVFQLRLTADELLNLKEKAVPYQSVSNYIRKAVEEFTHVDVKQQIEMMQDLCAFYRKFQNELSWAGSNLNQSVRRVNELAVAGLLSPGYVNEVLLPSIQDVQNILKRIKDDLETLNNRTRLIKYRYTDLLYLGVMNRLTCIQFYKRPGFLVCLVRNPKFHESANKYINYDSNHTSRKCRLPCSRL